MVSCVFDETISAGRVNVGLGLTVIVASFLLLAAFESPVKPTLTEIGYCPAVALGSEAVSVMVVDASGASPDGRLYFSENATPFTVPSKESSVPVLIVFPDLLVTVTVIGSGVLFWQMLVFTIAVSSMSVLKTTSVLWVLVHPLASVTVSE